MADRREAICIILVDRAQLGAHVVIGLGRFDAHAGQFFRQIEPVFRGVSFERWQLRHCAALLSGLGILIETDR